MNRPDRKLMAVAEFPQNGSSQAMRKRSEGGKRVPEAEPRKRQILQELGDRLTNSLPARWSVHTINSPEAHVGMRSDDIAPTSELARWPGPTRVLMANRTPIDGLVHDLLLNIGLAAPETGAPTCISDLARHVHVPNPTD